MSFVTPGRPDSIGGSMASGRGGHSGLHMPPNAIMLPLPQDVQNIKLLLASGG